MLVCVDLPLPVPQEYRTDARAFAFSDICHFCVVVQRRVVALSELPSDVLAVES